MDDNTLWLYLENFRARLIINIHQYIDQVNLQYQRRGYPQYIYSVDTIDRITNEHTNSVLEGLRRVPQEFIGQVQREGDPKYWDNDLIEWWLRETDFYVNNFNYED